jgi:hypothetical protein
MTSPGDQHSGWYDPSGPYPGGPQGVPPQQPQAAWPQQAAGWPGPAQQMAHPGPPGGMPGAGPAAPAPWQLRPALPWRTPQPVIGAAVLAVVTAVLFLLSGLGLLFSGSVALSVNRSLGSTSIGEGGGTAVAIALLVLVVTGLLLAGAVRIFAGYPGVLVAGTGAALVLDLVALIGLAANDAPGLVYLLLLAFVVLPAVALGLAATQASRQWVAAARAG